MPSSDLSRSTWARRSQLAMRMRVASTSRSTEFESPAASRWTYVADAISPAGPPPTPSATPAPHDAVKAASWFTARNPPRSEAAAARSASVTKDRRSACEVTAVVLEDPADDSHEEHGDADRHDPGSDGEADHGERCRERKDDGPPRPGTEFAELRVAVVDIGRQSVLGQITTLSLVHAPDVERDQR